MGELVAAMDRVLTVNSLFAVENGLADALAVFAGVSSIVAGRGGTVAVRAWVGNAQASIVGPARVVRLADQLFGAGARNEVGVRGAVVDRGTPLDGRADAIAVFLSVWALGSSFTLSPLQ